MFRSFPRIRNGLALLALLVTGPAYASDAPLGFNRDIRPILADNCFNCHGQDAGARKGGLRLDERTEALKGGKSGSSAFVPGDPAQSELLLRVRSPHDDEVMPPADKKERLKPADIAKLERWIKDGAPYQPHWAFTPPEKQALPKTMGKGMVTPVDAWVAERRNAAGLAASPEAEPEVLVRRVWLDLVGLPPSLAEIDAFVAAAKTDRDGAYRALVDRLLASPRYGEKWARHWLDVARYADSDGYEKDVPRQQWAWRDWVIRSLNADKPYDQFVIEQVAGDLLMDQAKTLRERQDLLVATGFLRNSMVSEEGAIIAEQYRKEAMFDRMDCLGKAVVGLTLQCAQCHTHKFDPITHDEYYQLFAAIDNTYEATSRVYSPEKLGQIEMLLKSVAAADDQARRTLPDWQRQLESWSSDVAAANAPWRVLEATTPEWEGGLCHPDILPDHSVLTLGFRPTTGYLVFTAAAPLQQVGSLRLEALTHGDLIFGGPGRSVDGLFAVTDVVVETQAPGAKDWTKQVLTDAKADFESPARPMGPFYSKGDDDKRKLGPAAFAFDGKDETAWSPDRGPGRRNAPVEVTAVFKEPLQLAAGTQMRVTLHFKHGGKDIHGRNSHHLGRYRVSVASTSTPPAPVRPDVRAAALMPPASRSADQQQLLFTAWREQHPGLVEIKDRVEALWRTFPSEDTTVLHLAERRSEDVRHTHTLDRGAWDKPAKPVTFATPAFLPELKQPTEPPRLVFARWLVDRRSPTAARVAVNRVWQALFGAGLVDTPEDFGVRASAPAQPDVLDGLAVEFMERGWSQKELIRLIVTSATYRQTSRVAPAALEKDPRNRLLARGPRFRAEAELVRDIALQTAGLLHEELGGPSVFPPVPESLFSESYLDVDFWKTATGKDRYRRSLYVFRRRSMPDPVLASFDAPNGDSACAGRVRSNTPLAALTGLNETVFVESAQALALRILREGGRTDADRAAFGFRLCTGRKAKRGEVDDLLTLIRASRLRMADGWVPARVVAFGDADKLPALPAGTTPNDAAAWTIASRVLLNLDETLSKN
ncbi:MAG: PSD1 and planctomycete cytochrome C domain-containing protein [Opitutaceae bacterium]